MSVTQVRSCKNACNAASVSAFCVPEPLSPMHNEKYKKQAIRIKSRFQPMGSIYNEKYKNRISDALDFYSLLPVLDYNYSDLILITFFSVFFERALLKGYIRLYVIHSVKMTFNYDYKKNFDDGMEDSTFDNIDDMDTENLKQDEKCGDELLIDLIRSRLFLYNKKLKEYRDNNMKENAWTEIFFILELSGKYI